VAGSDRGRGHEREEGKGGGRERMAPSRGWQRQALASPDLVWMSAPDYHRERGRERERGGAGTGREWNGEETVFNRFIKGSFVLSFTLIKDSFVLSFALIKDSFVLSFACYGKKENRLTEGKGRIGVEGVGILSSRLLRAVS
jgi:hypothetical protein